MTTEFAVLRFSPEPEFTEYVNVALLLFGERVSLVYDRQFPKLRCISPAFSTDVLESWLQQLERDIAGVKSRDDARMAIESRTGQLQFTKFARLSSEPSQETIGRLCSLYLHAHRRAVVHVELASKRRGPRFESLLDDFLRSQLRVNGNLLKKASPNQFLSPEVEQRIQNGFTISRVVSGPKKLLLLDGVDLALSSEAVAKRVKAVCYSFFVLSEVRELIRTYENRDLVTASVIFNSAAAEQDSHHRFAVHELRRESNIFVDAEGPQDESRLLRELLGAGATRI